MRDEPAGDFDYEQHGQHYSSIRRPDPHIAAAVRRALGAADSLINVGAGAGSYEPDDIEVTAVEPSASMRSQRPLHLVEAIDAVAEDLPFPDDAFAAALASVTIHQWPDLDRGLSEIRRVTRGPVVILTFEPVALGGFWLAEYAPELMECESARMPTIDRVTASLGGRASVDVVPLRADCTDGFAEAFFGRPEAFLDERVRRAQSAWGFIGPEVEERSVEVLRTALDDGSWNRQHGGLRTLAEYPGSMRLITAFPD